MVTWWQALGLGVVEGLTEFLPVSSTAHLILAAKLWGLAAGEFLKSFEIIIQTGAIAAVIILYWRRFTELAVVKRVLVAFLPTAILGLLLYPIIKTYLLGSITVVLWALGLGGLALIGFEKYFVPAEPGVVSNEAKALSYRRCLLIGLCQSLALVPGVSRAAATIVGGLLLGLSRQTIVEFSFLLAVPTLVAASGLDLVKNVGTFSVAEIDLLLVGFVASLLTALVSITFLLRYISHHNFTPFGWYRLLIVALFWLFIF